MMARDALKDGSLVHLHAGTAEVVAKAIVLRPVEEQRPVGQSGERVVHRLVPEFLLQVGDLAQIALEPSPLE